MRLFEGTPFDRPPHCERCDQLETECQCPPVAAPTTPSSKQTVRLALERRKGKKLITTLRGLVDEENHLADVLSKLKATCGAGGSLQAGVLELQGDQRERARDWLLQQGYRVK